MALNNELSGITVISIEQAVAAPYCGLLLADAGARVIKVERPEGDFARGYDTGAGGESTIFAWLNRGKESICLDLKQTGDQDLLRQMLTSADVLLSNLAPGALDRMGFSRANLRSQNSKLIYCAITGYGETGPAAKKKAYDFLIQGESGLCSVTGNSESPSKVGISITDISTGLTAFSAILRALIQREKTHTGADLSVSMFDVMADWMNMPLLAERYLGGAPARSGLKHSLIAPYGSFRCGDGGQVLLSVQSNREFKSFCEDVLQRPEIVSESKFVDNTSRHKNRFELDKIIEDSFSNYDTAQVINLLDIAKIANSRLNDVSDLSNHPFLRNCEVEIGEHHISMAALPIEGASLSKVPSLGSHTEMIREEFRNQKT